MQINVKNIPFSENSFQTYTQKDSDLINSIKLQRKFGLPEDYIELHIYDLNDNLLKSNYNYNNYKSLINSLPSPTNQLTSLNVDPANDSINEGYKQGSVKLVYNIFRNLFGSNVNNKFFIKTISSDRTELRIANNSLSNDDLTNFYNNFLTSFVSEAFYKDFYLNFGSDIILIGVNVILEQDSIQNNLLIKLYEPLPINIELKDQFWLIDILSEPISFKVDFILEDSDINPQNIFLKGPNFNIKLNDEINSSIDYKTYDQLFSTTSTSSYQQLKSLLEEKSLEINVDYTDYNNFIHFSSAKERLLNFVYKLKLIEGYQSDIRILGTSISTPQVSSSKAILQENINNLIEKFDGYEYFLYYNSGSEAWPKKNSTPPFINYETTSSVGIVWLGNDIPTSSLYGGQLTTASLYDANNQDNLINTIPEYLRIDSQNENYEIFIHMIGQHFDNIWLHAKGILDLYKADNNLEEGISKDLVAYALKSLGVKLYTNTSTTDNVFSYLLGVTNSGSLLPSTGSELITTLVTASSTSLPGSDIDKEVYKRIYHNLPFLLKSKGTERGLRALIACYGIPDTIFRINEFGGTDKDSGSFEQYFDRLGYSLNTNTGSVYVQTYWAPSYYQSILTSSGNIVPDTIEFRFKTNGIPSSSFYSQSLFQVGIGSTTQFGVQLIFTSESNSGSYNDYGDLKLVISGNQGYTYSSPIHLPFFDRGWWNVMILRETGSIISSSITNSNTYWIYAADSIYNGVDGDDIGYIGSSSIFITGSSISSSYHRSWNLYNTGSLTAFLGGNSSSNKIGSGTTKFNGYFSEFRYWSVPVPKQNFINHTLNPLSIELIDVTSSYSSLIFRLPLGNDLVKLNTNSITSVHPTIPKTGSFLLSNSIASNAEIVTGSSTINYGSDTSFYYLNSGNVGYIKPVNNKIRIIDQDIVSGSTLSPFIKIEQKPEIPLTKDLNITEVIISPQDQINNDIISQLGYFDIDDYIGDPRESGSREYSNLKSLRDFYFKKYIKSYNYFDLIRLIKYFNNSLFKMIKDFTPARTNITTGIVIKPHYLERSKAQKFEPNINIHNNFTESIEIEEINGGEGGSLKLSNNYSFDSYKQSISGGVLVNNNKKWEPFTGELSGSNLKVTNQNLTKLSNDRIVYINSTAFFQVFSASNSGASVTHAWDIFSTESLGTPPNTSSNWGFTVLGITNNELTNTIKSGSNAISSSDLLSFSSGSYYGGILNYVIKLNNDSASKPIFLNCQLSASNQGVLYTTVVFSSIPTSSTTFSGSINLFNTTFDKIKINLNNSGGYVSTIALNSLALNAGNPTYNFISTNKDYNYTLNNVSSSKVSKRFFKIDYTNNSIIASNLNLITSSSPFILSETQDSNYTLLRNVNPRYAGSKTISKYYNIYTEGDKAYGKTAAIDNQVRKLGLFNNISNSVFFPDKSEISLKYLVDEFGNLTELNTQNKNWFELQNTFKSGEILTIGQFDPLKFGNQKKLDGNKVIWSSGYSYLPLFYFSSSDSILNFSSENDRIRYFAAGNQTILDLSGSTLSGLDSVIPDSTSSINYFNTASVDGGQNYIIGLTSSYYVIPTDGVYSFNIGLHFGAYFYENTAVYSMSLSNTSSLPVSYSYFYRHYQGPTLFDSPNQHLTIVSLTLNSGSTQNFTVPTLTGADSILLHSISASNGILSASIYNNQSILTSSNLYLSASFDFAFLVNNTILTSSGINFALSNSLSGTSTYDSNISISRFFKAGDIVWPRISRHNLSNYIKNFDSTTQVISSSVIGISVLNQTSSYNQYPISLYDRGSTFSLLSSTPLITINSSSGSFIQSINSSSISLTSSISNVYISSSYIPNSSSLYSMFGDITDNFSSSKNDILITLGPDGIRQYNITNVFVQGGTGSLVFEISSFFNSETTSNIKYILILKRKNDETNTIVNYKKTLGATSYGFIIPNNLHPDVFNNIDIITKEVKTKLLEINSTLIT